MPQVESTEKRGDDTEIMRTSSSSPSSTVISEDASEFRFGQFDRVVNTPAVQQTASIVFSDYTETDAEHQEDPEDC